MNDFINESIFIVFNNYNNNKNFHSFFIKNKFL